MDLDSKHYTSVLLGKNGTGKSNVIEAIASIFKNIYIAKKQSDLLLFPPTNRRRKDIPYYEFDYECDGHVIKLKTTNGIPQILIREKNSNEFVERSLSYLRSTNKERGTFSYLPQFIIGYYSGVAKRAEEIFEEIEKVEIEKLKKEKGHAELFRPMFFVKNYHSSIILLTLNLIRKKNKAADQILTKYLNIEEIGFFSITLKSPMWNSKSKKPISIVESLNDFWGAGGNAHKFLNYLETIKEESLLEGSPQKSTKVSDERYTMFFNMKKVRKDVYGYLGSAIEFFRGLENIFLADFIEKIDFGIKKKRHSVAIEFDKLSEGEQQLIAVLGLMILTDNYETLYLLDEPDTHLNPIWQRDYVELIRKSDHHKRNSQAIISTHSPLILQASQNSDVFLFSIDKSGNISASRNQYKLANWRIDQVLVSDYFDLESSRPPYLDYYFKRRNKILSKSRITKEDKKYLKQQEEKFGYLPSGETIEDIETLAFLRSQASSKAKQ